MRTNLSTTTLRALAGMAILGLAGAALAQNAGQPGAQVNGAQAAAADRWDKNDPEFKASAEALRDFIHFIRINRSDVAAGLGRQLLAKNLKPTHFVDLVEGSGELTRFQDTIGRAMRSPELEPVAGAMLKLYERGKLDRVRNADEIKRNLRLLKGMQRARIEGHERLVAAGEYAVPQLLEALLNRADIEMQAQAQGVLISLGQQAVMPLCTALHALDPASQETVADILGLIRYRTSVPFLHDLLMKTSAPNVKASCERALTRIGASGMPAEPAALYEWLGESYYAHKPELTSFPGEEHQLLWAFTPQIGLHMTAVRTEVFHEAMSMRMAEKSLALRPQGNGTALSLWLASNFRREIETPQSYQNPAYPAGKRDAMYFAVAAGAGPSQAVLARALNDKHTPLARRAIAAIEQTAGGGALWAGEGEQRPLLDSLRYPNRRVQYEAALALGKAQPTANFGGSERVVPLLASAIRDASARYAVVVSGDKELGDSLRKILEKGGYTVLPVAMQLGDAQQGIAEAPGIDLIVSSLSGDRTQILLDDVRMSPKLAATPVLSLVEGQPAIDLARRFERDPLVAIRARGLNEGQITAAVMQLVDNATGGPVSAEEAREYATRSLAVLRDLALAGNRVFDVGEACLPLISALTDTQGQTRLEVAEVLSRIEQKRAQVALMDAALNAADEERIALLAKVADSAKRYGNLLEPRQVERAMELAVKGKDQEATAAAALVGSLKLPNANLVPLILGTQG
ncbi:MAG: HEAT repeat domain-containing protein [Phycisphaerales bacterium]